jgi:hypothetical protein
VFKGDRCNDLAVFDFIVEVNERCASLGLPQDDLLRHAKLLFKGDALIWYRMVENRVSSWPDLCDRLKEEFLPIGYSDTARENLLRYRQTGGQTIGMFLARFEQLESYLPRPLLFPEKMTAIRRNILPYYQDRLWDKEVDTPDELYRLCRRLDANRFSIDQHVERNHTRTVRQMRQRHQRSLPLVWRKLLVPVARKRATKFAIASTKGKLSVSGAVNRTIPSRTVQIAHGIWETGPGDSAIRSRVALHNKLD